jgi:hypothetical protein
MFFYLRRAQRDSAEKRLEFGFGQPYFDTDAATLACSDVDSGVLLKFILSLNVCPPSVEALNITSNCPVLLLHHTTYTFSPDTAIGASSAHLTAYPSACCSC